MAMANKWDNIPGNPSFDNPKKLYSETGYNMAIRSNGTIEGTQDDEDPDCVLEVIYGGAIGSIRIRSCSNHLYVCFDQDGHLYGEANKDNPYTVFTERFQGSYTVFGSTCNPNWYVGIKKSGKAKPGNRTHSRQKAVKFLPRHVT